MNSIVNLQDRKSVKLFDGSLLPSLEITNLVKACNLAPTSLGLQPVRLVTVTSKKNRDLLRAATYNQPQIDSCSHMFVLCVKTSMNKEYVKGYLKLIRKTRKVTKESLQGFKATILNWLARQSEEQYLTWAKNQAYLALGTLITVCANEGIDTCPIEGFISNVYDDVLKLKDRGLTSVILCAVGKKSDQDLRSKEKKVRIKNYEFHQGQY